MSNSWTTRTSILLILLIAGAGASLPWVAHDALVGGTEAAHYLQTARGLVADGEDPYYRATSSLRPPGFPVLLAPIVRAFDFRMKAYTLFVSHFGLAIVVAMFLFFRRHIGDFPATAVAVAIWIHPTFHLFCNAMLPVVPGAALLLGALAIDAWARNSTNRFAEVLLGASIAAATYVTTLSALLLPAILFSRAAAREDAHGKSRRFLAALVVAVMLLAPWGIQRAVHSPIEALPHTWSALRAADEPGPETPLLVPTDDAGSIPHRAAWALSTLGHRLRDASPSTADALLGVFLAVSLGVAFVRRRGPGELLALLALFVFCVSRPRDGRELLPVYLFALPALVELLRTALRRVPRLRRIDATLAVTILAVGILDARSPLDWGELEARHEARREEAATIRERVPPGAMVAVYGPPDEEVIYLDRPVVPLVAAWEAGGLAEVQERLRDAQVRAVVVRSGAPRELHDFLVTRLSRESLGPRLVLYGPSLPS